MGRARTGVFLDTPGRLAHLRPRRSCVRCRRSCSRRTRTTRYKIFGATEDSPSAYKLLVEVDSVVNVGHGLRTRPVRIDPTPVRYLRVGEPLGDSAYSISEFQAYCRAPNPFPPKLPIVDAPAAKVVEAPW